MERRRNAAGFVGKGYNFAEEERTKVKEFRKELGKAWGFAGEGDEDDENMEIVKSA